MDLKNIPLLKIRSYTAIVATGWTLIILLLLGIEHYGVRRQILESARIEARTSIEKDIAYRRWNALHGGVYVPITADAQPNPYLQVPNRDVTTTDGLELTLMNPVTFLAQPHFIRGDCDGDGRVTGRVSDAMFLLEFNYVLGSATLYQVNQVPVPAAMLLLVSALGTFWAVRRSILSNSEAPS